MRRIALVLGMVTCVLWMAACDIDNNLTWIPGENPLDANAAIEVTPETLDFGQLNAGDVQTLTVTVTSVGDDILYLEDVFIEGPSSFSVDDGDTVRILAKDSSTTIQVTYQPLSDEHVAGTLHMTSNDRTMPDAQVDLLATGLAPAIEIDPATWDFGDHEVGCEAELQVTIRNIGSAPLVLDEPLFQPTSDELQASWYFDAGETLDPDGTATVWIYYDPRDELPDTGYLHVTSNDPAHPDAMAMQFGAAHLADEAVDEFEQDGNNWTDILWVVDNSCSMSDNQANLATNFGSFLDIVEVLDIDYHIAVCTTDSSSLHGAIPIITPSTPDPRAAFADAVYVGTMGSSTERGFKYGIEALTPPMTSPGGANDGFLRQDAGLRVIFVSDEEEQSSDTVTSYVNQFWALKTNPEHVVLSAIYAMGNTQRYGQAAQMTGGLEEDLTNPNWVNTLSNLAWLAQFWQDTFELSRDPVPETIEVELNGVPVYVGWYYDEVFNAVVFEQDYVPDTGDVVRVRYNLMGSCDG